MTRHPIPNEVKLNTIDSSLKKKKPKLNEYCNPCYHSLDDIFPYPKAKKEGLIPAIVWAREKQLYVFQNDGMRQFHIATHADMNRQHHCTAYEREYLFISLEVPTRDQFPSPK